MARDITKQHKSSLQFWNWQLDQLLQPTAYRRPKTMPEPPSSVPNAIASSVNGIIREFGYCWRYVAASARSCLPEEECIPVVGVFFEVFEEDWVNLRLRENEYAILQVRASIWDKQHLQTTTTEEFNLYRNCRFSRHYHYPMDWTLMDFSLPGETQIQMLRMAQHARGQSTHLLFHRSIGIL